MVDFRVVIPVRLNSKRLAKKALCDIAGKPMFVHTYEKAVASGPLSVVVATDSEEIASVAKSYGIATCMTSNEHKTGTDRLGEAVVALGYEDDDIVINLQGDEPLAPPAIIRQLAEDAERYSNVKLTTLCEKINDEETLFNPDVVKVVRNQRGFAIYFSRAPVPWDRDGFSKDPKSITGPFYRHIGIYAYRVSFLSEYLSWHASPLDSLEALEQLRVLWNGQRIHCSEVNVPVPLGVDTHKDLDRVRNLLSKQKAE